MKEIHFTYFKSSIEHIITSKPIITILFILEYFLFSINMFVSNYYLLNYRTAYNVYKNDITVLSCSLTHIVHSQFKECHLNIMIPFIVIIVYVVIIIVSHVEKLPMKAMMVFVNVLEFAICRVLFMFIMDVISNQVLYYGNNIHNGSVYITAFLFFIIALIAIVLLIIRHISTHCSLCYFAVNYCFDVSSKTFEKWLLLIKVLISVNLNLLEMNADSNGNVPYLFFLNLVIVFSVLSLTLHFSYSAYVNCVYHINSVLYTKLRLVFLFSLSSESILFLVFHNHTDVMFIMLSVVMFISCIVISVNYNAMSLCLSKVNYDNAFEHVLMTLHLTEESSLQTQRVIYIKNIRYHFIFCKQCYLCKSIMDMMLYKTVSVTNKEEVCAIIEKYQDVFMKEVERRVRKRNFFRFYYDLLCLINLTRRQKGFNFKVQYLCHKLVQKYYKESDMGRYMNIKFIYLNFVNLNSLKESSKFKLMEDTISLTQKVIDVIRSIKQIIRGKIKSSRDFIVLSNQMRILKSKDIKKFLSNRDNMQSYPVVLLRLIIEDMLSIPIKKEEGLLRKEKNYSEDFLDYHFLHDNNMLIEVTLQRNSFVIRKTGNELINYVNHELAKLFPSKIKKSGIDTLKDLINSTERKKLFSFVIHLNLPLKKMNVVRTRKMSHCTMERKDSFVSSDSTYSYSENQQAANNNKNSVILSNIDLMENEMEYYLFDFYFTVSPGINNSDLSLIGEYYVHRNDLLISQISDNGFHNVFSTGIGNECATSDAGRNGNSYPNAHGSTVIMGDLLWLKDTSCNAIICSNRNNGGVSTQNSNAINNETNMNNTKSLHNSKVKVNPCNGSTSNLNNDNEIIFYVSKMLFSTPKLKGIRNLNEFKKNFGNIEPQSFINSPYKSKQNHLINFIHQPPQNQSFLNTKPHFSPLLQNPYPTPKTQISSTQFIRRPRAVMNCSTIIVPNNKHIFNELESLHKKPTISYNNEYSSNKPIPQTLNTLTTYFTKKDKDGNYLITKDKDDYSLIPQLSIKSGKKIYKIYLFIKVSNCNNLYLKRKSQFFELGSTLQMFQKDTVKIDDTQTATKTGTGTHQGDGLGNFIDGSSSVHTLSSNTSILSVKLYKKEDKTFKAETEREQRLIVYKNRFHTFTVVIISFSFFIIVINVISLIVNFYLNAELISVNNIYSDSKETNRLFYSLLSSFFSTMCVGYKNSTECVNYLYERCKEDEVEFNLTTNIFKYVKRENEMKLDEMITLTKKLKKHIYRLNSERLNRMFNVDFKYLTFGVVNNEPSITSSIISFSHALEVLSTSLNTILKYPKYSVEPIYIITSLSFDMSNVYGMNTIKEWQLEYYNVLLNYKTYLLTFENIQSELYLSLQTQMKIHAVVPLLFLVLNYFLHLVLFGLLSVYLKSFLTLVKMDMNNIIKKTKDKEYYKFYIKKYNILLALLKYYEKNPNYLIHKLDSLLRKRTALSQANHNLLKYNQQSSKDNNKNVYMEESILLVNGQNVSDYTKNHKQSEPSSTSKNKFIHSATYITELNIPVTFQLLLIIYLFLIYFTTFFIVFLVVWLNATGETSAKIKMVESITDAEYSTYNDFTLIQIMLLGNITEYEISNILTNNTNPNFLAKDIHDAMKITYNYEKLNNINNNMMPLIKDKFEISCDIFYKEIQDEKLNKIEEENKDEHFIENIETLCKGLDWFVVPDEIMVYKHLFYSMYKLLKSFDDRSYGGIMKLLNDENIFKVYYYEYFVVRFMVTWYNSVVYKEKINESTQTETMILIIYLVIEISSELGLFLVLSKLFFKAIKQTNNNLTLLTRAFFTQ